MPRRSLRNSSHPSCARPNQRSAPRAHDRLTDQVSSRFREGILTSKLRNKKKGCGDVRTRVLPWRPACSQVGGVVHRPQRQGHSSANVCPEMCRGACNQPPAHRSNFSHAVCSLKLERFAHGEKAKSRTPLTSVPSRASQCSSFGSNTASPSPLIPGTSPQFSSSWQAAAESSASNHAGTHAPASSRSCRVVAVPLCRMRGRPRRSGRLGETP